MVWFFVFVRIVSNPISNAFQKALTNRSGEPHFIICVTHGLLVIPCLPLVCAGLGGVTRGFWWNIVICAALAVAGNTLLVQAVRLSDLSVLGPINAYKSVVSLVPGMVLLGEFPRPMGLAAIGLIVAGSYFLADPNERRPRESAYIRLLKNRGVQYRFAALALSATEAVFLKRALLDSSAITTFAFWAVLGFVISALAILAFISGAKDVVNRQGAILWDSGRACLLLALTTGFMQLTTLLTFSTLKVGYALALFQTSTLLTVILGRKIFHEQHFARRMIGSAVMVAGAVLIIVSK